MMKSSRSLLWHYGFAVLTVALTLFLAYFLRQFGVKLDLSWLFIVVLVIIAWYAGRGPGLLTALLFVLIAGLRSTPSFTLKFIFREINLFGLLALFVVLTSARRQAEKKLKVRARQQAAVAQFGQQALASSAHTLLSLLIDEAASLAARHLEVDHSSILELLPDGQMLQLQAGFGWEEGLVGHLMVDAGTGSQGGYTLLSREPVVVTDLRRETRFTVLPLLLDHQVTSAVSVIIPGGKQPFGVLSVHTTKRRKFNDDDLNFLQSIANVLAEAIERRRAEESLQRSQAQLSGIIGSAMDVIITVDEEQRVTLFNAAAEEMFGCTTAEATGQLLERFIPERFLQAHCKPIPAFSQTHVTKRRMGSLGTIYGLRANGEEFPIEASISQIEIGGQKYYTVILRDITERSRVEEEQKRLQGERDQLLEQLQLQMDFMPIGLMLTDADFHSTYWNPAAKRIFGFSNEEILGTDSKPLIIPPDLQAEVEEILRRIVAGETILSDINENLTKDGRRIICDWYGTPLRKPDGTFVGIMLMVEDVTERKQAGTRQAKLEAQLRQSQKMEAIGTLAGGIAHDFNNMLGAILGYSELALLDMPEGHRSRPRLDQVLKASFRAKELVQQILAFSRQQEHERKPIQLPVVIEEALKLLRATLPSTIEIRQHLDPHACPILGDPTQIHQVIMNLGTNAYHAMSERGGILEVSLITLDVDAEFARTNAELHEGRYLRLMISDTGQGMDRATLERIFEPFFTTKPVGIGTGMGLSVVHGVVKNHEGSISVYSEPGKGTTFNLYFPAHGSEAAPEVIDSTSLQSGRGERILFVDDEEPLAALGKEMLECLGYQVTAQTNSIEALDLFRAHPDQFDLVVTDQTMPHLEGADFAKALLQIRPELPVLLVTGYSTTINPEKAQKVGIREMLMKPVTTQTLGEAIDRTLGQRVKGKSHA